MRGYATTNYTKERGFLRLLLLDRKILGLHKSAWKNIQKGRDKFKNNEVQNKDPLKIAEHITHNY